MEQTCYGEAAGVLVGAEVCQSNTTWPQERPCRAPGFCAGGNGSVDCSGSNWKPVTNDMANSSAGAYPLAPSNVKETGRPPASTRTWRTVLASMSVSVGFKVRGGQDGKCG